MRVAELIGALRLLPPDARVYIDYEEYPSVAGVYAPDFDPADPIGTNVAMIEIQFPPSEPKDPANG